MFESHRSLPLEWRKRQLRGIKDMVQRHEEELVAALRQDLGANDFWWVATTGRSEMLWSWSVCTLLTSGGFGFVCVAVAMGVQGSGY